MGTNYDVKVTSKMEKELKKLNISPLFSENALKILEKRYLMKDNDNNVIETPKDMLARVSANIAYADYFYGASYEEVFEFAKKIYAMMSNLEFLPNSPALRGAGRETQQLSACFVLPIEDSRKSIFGTLRDAVDIQAYGGGCVGADSSVYIEGRGLIKISEIEEFNEVNDLGKPFEINGLETISYDKVLKMFVRSKITHLWKFHVPLQKQRILKFKEWTYIRTSEWHPFILHDGSEKEAKDLVPGDKILIPSERTAVTISGTDADFDWLMGYLYGDGSIDESIDGTRVRFFDENEKILQRAKDIVERYTDISYKIQKDIRNECNYFCLTAQLNSEHGNSNEKVRNFIKRIKEYNIRTDIKNPLYFLAGFFDAEGYWGHDSSAFSNADEELIQYIRELCSLCGINTNMRRRTNTRGHVWYEAKFANFHLKRLPTVKTGRIPQGGTSDYVEIEDIETPDSGDTTFYDFTVDKYNNYLAGQGILVVVHNTGFNFSKLRAKGTKVESTGGKASGPISFMQIYDIAVGKVIAQGGVRQGANMGILAYNHPDVLEFIDAKLDGKTLSNFNISVGVNEEFMEMAEKGQEYALIDPHTKKALKQINAKDVLDKIAHNAWSTGDPGLIFLDRINAANPTPHIGVIESTNPCGELPLLPWESCNLGSINLYKMIKEENGKYVVDYQKLEEVVKNGVHFLDNVIDMNRYPIEKIEEMTKANRKIGLGVMGWADMLARLGIPYNSEEALELADKVMEFINTKAKEASVELATIRGVFPNFKGSIYDTGRDEDKVRNASWTTIAPTGTLSTLANCNGGIEPFFMIVYSRGSIYDSEGKPTIKMLIENDIFKEIAIKREFYATELMEKIAETGSIQHVDGIPEDVKKIFVTSHDISYEWHLKMQSAFQKHVTNAVSKTINFPNSATVEDIKKSYILAYKLGNIKGVTVYRDGCKQYQVLSAVETKKEEKKAESAEDIILARLNAPRPRKIAGTTDRIETPVGKLYMTINKANGRLYEVFLNIGKAGADITADAEGYGRLLSMLFKIGVPPELIIDQLRGIGGSGSIGFGKERVRSLPDGIARVLEMYLEDNPSESNSGMNGNGGEPKISGNLCPECGNMLIFEEGCTKCRNCGYSRC